MPGYQAPDGRLLKEFTEKLDTKYTGKNPERKKLISLMQQMHTHSETAILGAYVFGLEKIGYEYTGVTGNLKKAYGFFAKAGSELSDVLKQGINLDEKNALDDKQKLILLNQFRKDIKAKPLVADEKELKSLHDEIKSVTDRLIASLKPEIDKTLRNRPTARALREAFAKIPQEYTEKAISDSMLSNRVGHSIIGYKDRRDQYIKFIEVLHDAELKKHFASTDGGWPASYAIPYATLLHIRNQINKEYKLLRSPRGNSRLFDFCEDALNISPGTEVPTDIQNVYFAKLLSVVAELANDPQAVVHFTKRGMKNPKEFFTAMQQELIEELAEVTNPEKTSKYTVSDRVASAVAWSTQLGISIATGSIAERLFPSLANNILSRGMALAGFVSYGAMGEIIFTNVGGKVETELLGLVSTGLGLVLNPIGTGAGYIAGTAVSVVITAGQKGIQFMVFHGDSKTKDLGNTSEQEWIQTLYDVLPEKDRTILRKINDNLKDENQQAVELNATAAAIPAVQKI